MQSNFSSMFFFIILIALMFAMTWWSSKKTKQRQSDLETFRTSLEPGTEVATASGLLGRIVSVDLEKEQVVIDSEGTKSRWRIQAITQPPIVPAYVHDDEVDEEGNPLQETSHDAACNDEDSQADTDSNKDAQQVTESSTEQAEQEK